MKFFKCLVFLVLMMLMLSHVKAQQKHFIYIQTADKQPFAVVMNGKVFSSSDYGYVIVPKLAEGTYNFTVSFPLNKYPDQKFNCVIDKKDIGFTLKNTNNNWSLSGAQKDNSVANNTSTVNTSTTSNNSANNAFGNMLSQVANDSNLTTKNQAVKKVDTATEAANNVTSNTNDVANATVPAVKAPATNVSNIATAAAATNAALQKLSEEKQDTGTRMVFIDNADTVKVFIPATSIAADTTNSTFINKNTNTQPQQSTSNIETNPQHTVTNTSTTLKNADTAHDVSNPFYNQAAKQNNSTSQTLSSVNATTSADVKSDSTTKTSGTVKNDCSYTLNDNDIDKIRRKMFVQKNDYNMVQAAVKYLGEKCITTEQVKTLGNLFSSDDGRYTLYDALYKNTYDFGNYASLETQILDPYYKKRFETMLR